MVRFLKCIKSFLTYYSCLWVSLIVLYFWLQHPIILGLIVGLLGSTFNTFIFEYYLYRAQNTDVGHISTGGGWRYLIAILACSVWVMFQAHIHILGVLIGLMVSYVFIIFRPLILKDQGNTH